MLNKATVLRKEAPAPRGTEDGEGGRLLVGLVYSISAELAWDPGLYQTENSLWIFYPHSGFLCDSLLEAYGQAAAVVSRSMHISFCGSTEGQETGEISISWPRDSGTVYYEKRDISGRDFSQLSDLCVRLGSPDAALLAEWGNILRHLDHRSDFLAVRRNAVTAAVFAQAGEVDPDTYFRILPLNGYADPADAFLSLSLEQQERLWLLLLCDGVSALEFEYVLSAWEAGRLSSLFSWELSLRMALDKSGVKITYRDGGFQVAGSGGRLAYDFATGSAAEKLFLKILFPAAPKRLGA